jgi:chaperonin GroES
MATPTKEEFTKYIQSKNLVDEIHEDALAEMGRKVIDWFELDLESRKDWQERYDEYLKLASQVKEKKNFPWPNAANVKFPLLTTAAMQFAARAYPALVPGPNLVAGLVIGRDEPPLQAVPQQGIPPGAMPQQGMGMQMPPGAPSMGGSGQMPQGGMQQQPPSKGGLKAQKAQRVGRHMSYQLLWEMDNWEEEMDKLCIILPIAGCMFKKTYFDPMTGKNCSDLILPTDLVIDYYAKSIETASRKSQIIWRTDNEIKERVNKGLFLDLDYKTPLGEQKQSVKNEIDGTSEPDISPATPHKFIECHCNWDLDNDGYEEPYIITVHYDTRQVARVVTRFNVDGIETEINEKTGKERFIRIKATEYFTKFGFIPNPDGSIYDVGFGLLLGAINESVNTLTNQLLDSGTINNLQAGFLGRGIRVRAGNTKFNPGEWKSVDFTGDDIKKHIFALPTKEPSQVLFKLLETLVTSGKELASVAEIFVGKMPGQNTPATTTMATIEQGLKVFTAIYKRIYRALGKEYQKLFSLNSLHLPDEKIYFTINEPDGPVGQEVVKTDYDPKDISVKPFADPNVVSSAQKLMRVQSQGPLLQLGTINPKEYTKRFLEAIDEPDIATLMNVPPPGPTPEQQKIEGELKIKQADSQAKGQQLQSKGMLDSQAAQQKAQLAQLEAQIEQKSKEMDMKIKAAEAQIKQQEAFTAALQQHQDHVQKLTQQADEHRLGMAAQMAQHQLDLKHTEELAKVKAEAVRIQAQAKPKPQQGTN